MTIFKVVRSKYMALAVFLLAWVLVVYCLSNNQVYLVYPIIIVALAYEILTVRQRLKTFILLLIVGLLGWTLQSVEARLGTLIITNSIMFAPPWLGFLWSLFMSSTLRTMPFVFKNLITSFLFGCYALPGSYFFISKIGLAEIKSPIWQSLLLDSLISGFIFVITYYLLKSYFYKKGSLYV